MLEYLSSPLPHCFAGLRNPKYTLAPILDFFRFKTFSPQAGDVTSL